MEQNGITTTILSIPIESPASIKVIVRRIFIFYHECYTSLPEKVIIKNCATGNANKMVPKAASLSPSAVFISGIRLAHEAKQNPMLK